MSPHAQHFAERLRTALRLHTSEPRHRGSAERAHMPSGRATTSARTPGEEFAQRLRAAIDA